MAHLISDPSFKAGLAQAATTLQRFVDGCELFAEDCRRFIRLCNERLPDAFALGCLAANLGQGAVEFGHACETTLDMMKLVGNALCGIVPDSFRELMVQFENGLQEGGGK